jgi:hypothetical protein
MSKKASKTDAKPTVAVQPEAKAPEKLPTTLSELVAGATRVVLPQSVRFKRSHPRYAYWPGDTATLAAEHVQLLISGGFAELSADSQTAK